MGRMKERTSLYTWGWNWSYFLLQSAEVLKVPQCKPCEQFWPPSRLQCQLVPLAEEPSWVKPPALNHLSLGVLRIATLVSLPTQVVRAVPWKFQLTAPFQPSHERHDRAWLSVNLNQPFVMYANILSENLIGSSNLLRDSHAVCKNPW